MTLGEIIRMVRGRMTREEFAVAVGCSYFTVRRWELGLVAPKSQAHIRRLIDMGVPEDSIIAALRPVRAEGVAE